MPKSAGELSRDVGLMGALSRNGLLPSRGPSGSVRNRFRQTAVQTAFRVLCERFDGDVERFVSALDGERGEN